MSILGKWFKKDKKERLDKQTDVEVDEKVTEKKEDIVKAEAPKKAPAKKETAKKKEAEVKEEPVLSIATPDYMFHVIKRLHVTEKAADAEAASVYTFVVANNTTKNEIAKEIKQTYKVTPKKIRVMNMRGKRVRWGRNRGQRAHWKKALVYLKKGDKISLHEGT